MDDDEQAIRELISTWMIATRDGDTAKVLSLMTEDAIFMVPGGEPFGREVFETAIKAPGSPQIDGTVTVVELKVLGDWAFARNHIDLTITPPGSEPVRRSGYAMTLFRKDADSQWKLARDANLLA